ncbi:MAG: T9SS type A sorting domain-containing protein, partial [Chitinophagaceae bacterium]
NAILITNTCAPLPVSFKSFTAVRNHSNVLLTWVTASENNNKGFAVERNNNGNWEQVAFVLSQASGGNSDIELNYVYNDFNNVKGITNYRIRQEDFDKKSKYSNVVAVRGENQVGRIIVYPNPSGGSVNVVFESADVTRDVYITDMMGRTLKQWKNLSANNLRIDNLNTGMYSLRVINTETGEQLVEKIIVNK